MSRPGLGYAGTPPFEPPNPVYEAVECTLRELGLDRARAGTPEWNPLGDLISPGDRVIIKPTLVASKNRHERITGPKLAASSTHGSFLRPVLDYALRAAGPRGQVRVADSPIEGCDVERVAGPLGVLSTVDHLRSRGHDVRFLDLRDVRVVPRMVLDDVRGGGRSWNLGMLVRRRLAGDPLGYVVVDLGDRSHFAREDAPSGSRLRFHRSHYRSPVAHHTGGRHEYSMPRTVLDADVIIHLPKLKTHMKTGVTLGLKSAIGLSHEKYWLPHFTEGDEAQGGDEFARRPTPVERVARRMGRLPLPGDHSLIVRAPRLAQPTQVVDGGWEGNRTLWRTVLDLNEILRFADRSGRLGAELCRRMLTIVDGIVAGEGDGPLGATPVDAGLIVAGFDAARVDAAGARAMGFDPMRIPLVREGLREAVGATPSDEAERWHGERVCRAFRPPTSWPSLRTS